MEQTEAVALEALDIARLARALAIVDMPSYRRASELLLGIKALLERIADTFDPHIKRAFATHRGLLASKQATEAPLLEAERWLKGGLVAYDVAQEEIRKAEEARRQAQLQADDDIRRMNEAAALELEAQATGNDALLVEAQRVLAEPSTLPTIILPSLTPKVAGITHRDQWTAEVESVTQLVAHVAAHPEHLGLLQVNQPALNAMARALKGAMQIPGVRAVRTPMVAAGGRR